MSTSISASERRWLMAASIGVLAITSLPYLVGVLAATPDRVFTGLQVNPLDGVSYLAKMRLGWNGDWLFTLRFTAESGSGTFLFTYFIALGHLARLLNLPPILIFHAARLLGGFALLWMVYQLIARCTTSIDLRRRMWWLAALSSGLGWLAMLLGYGNSADLTIAESNTFYSLMANAHFALATALMIAMFLLVIEAERVDGRRLIGLTAASLLLSIVQPFAPFAVYGILGVTLLIQWWRNRKLPRTSLTLAVIVGLLTAPLLLTIYLGTQSDPTMRAWTAQNQTPSPPVLDYVIGYGLLWVLAMPGLRLAWQRRSEWDVLLLVWVIVTVPMLYAPIALQRRLSLGLHVPIALLAAQGLTQVVRGAGARRVILIATTLTSAFLVLALSAGAFAHDSRIYVSADEAAAFDWLQINAPRDGVVLAAPDTGAFIPAYTSQRVVYGHPYETVDAARKKQQVIDFFAGKIDRAALLDQVNYVFVGPREKALGSLDAAALGLTPVFESGEVTVYAVRR